MSNRSHAALRSRGALYALTLAAVLTILSPFMRILRTNLFDRGLTFHVTSGADEGPGSLRAAIFDADRAQSGARIVVDVPAVTLSTPLPPIVNPHGIALESRGTTAQINGGLVTGALIDIAAPNSAVSNLRIVGGRVGVIVRAARVTLDRLTVQKTDVGVFIGANASDVRVEQTWLLSNRLGLQISESDGLTTVRNSRFENNTEAGLWATSVGPTAANGRLALLDNRFREGARGIVLVGLRAEIEGNSFEELNGDAIHATEARVIVKGNTIRAGFGFGVYLQRAEAGRIEGNDIARNCAGGIMVRDATNAQVERNQIYQNGHGIVVMEGAAATPNAIVDNLVADDFGDGVVLIGATAVVAGNHVLRNRQAGIRFSSLHDGRGRENPGKLFLDRNTVTGNGRDEEHDVFRLQSDERPEALASAEDCGWRQGLVGLIASPGASR